MNPAESCHSFLSVIAENNCIKILYLGYIAFLKSSENETLS